MRLKKLIFAAFLFSAMIFVSCKTEYNERNAAIEKSQTELFILLEQNDLEPVSRYAIVNQIATNLVSLNDQQGLILFLTNWVEEHPEDSYNAYWLYLTACAYLSNGAEPVAEYYFDRILVNSAGT